MKEKSGEMTIGTIIAIVLGVAVLVFLIFGFSQGWNSLWERVTNIGGTDNNVDAVVSGCEVACASDSQYSYCIQSRSLKLGPGETPIIGSCNTLDIDVSCPSITCPAIDEE